MSFGPIAREAATPAPVEQCTRTLGANELAGGAETGKPRLEFGTSPYTIPQHVGAVGGEHPCVLHRSPEFGRPPGRFRRAGSSAAVRTDGTGCDRGACPDRHAPVWGLPAGRPPGRHDHRAVVAAALGSAARQPRRTSRRWPSSSGLEEARERADRAFKSRPRAFRYVIEIRVDHRELDGGRCRCSKRFDQCTIGQLLAGYPGLLGWERDQVERAKQGLDRRLPGNHPSLIDPRWAEAPRKRVRRTRCGVHRSALLRQSPGRRAAGPRSGGPGTPGSRVRHHVDRASRRGRRRPSTTPWQPWKSATQTSGSGPRSGPSDRS